MAARSEAEANSLLVSKAPPGRAGFFTHRLDVATGLEDGGTPHRRSAATLPFHYGATRRIASTARCEGGSGCIHSGDAWHPLLVEPVSMM
jgi:hypothetical protein